MEKYHFCTASVGADGLAGFHIPLHMSLLWDFPFLALLLLLAIYCVSGVTHAGTHWWVHSLDECCNCVDSVDRDFLVFFFLTSFV